MEVVSLQNDVLRAAFDRRTGALVELVSKRTGWRVQNRAELGHSFRLWVPLPDRRNNQVNGDEQTLTGCEPSADGKRLTLTWERPRSAHGGVLDLTLRAEITLDESGLTFQTTVTNRSPLTIEAVAYPCLGDLSVPSPAEPLDRLTWSYAGAARVSLWPKFINERGYFGCDYPIQLAPVPDTQFVLIASPTQGLYAGCHDATARHLVQFIFELKPGFRDQGSISEGLVPREPAIGGTPVHIEFSAVHLPYVAPGESTHLAPVALQPYGGSWHQGVDEYKRWRCTWHTPPHTPAWARQVHSWQQLHINSPEDELRCLYRELVKYGEDCARHGVAAIQLVGWNDGGQDRGNPSHDTDPRLGTWAELRDAIAAIHKLGVKIVLFNKYVWADRSQDWFRRELIRYASKDPYGDYHLHSGYQYQTPVQLSDLNTRRLIPMCTNSAAWREIACQEFRKGIALGAAGMLYDECCHLSGARYCFDTGHGHRVPAYLYAGDAGLEKAFHAITDQEAPDYLYAGEACYDLQYRHYSVSYFRLNGLQHLPIQRYVDPYAGIMVALTGHDDRHAINQCLMYRYILSYEPRNFKGRLDEFPLTLAYGKKMDALRRRYTAHLWDAEFRDTLEARVTVESGATEKGRVAGKRRLAKEGRAIESGHPMEDGRPYYPYTTFRQPDTGKRAVVVSSFSDDSPLRVAVELMGTVGKLVTVTPEAPEPQPCDGKLIVPARSAVVVLEM